MRENGTDRDIALLMVDKLTAISTLIGSINHNLYGPYITAQPTDQSGVVNDTVYFTVTALHVSAYQWEVDAGSGWVNSTLSGYNTDTLSVGVQANRDGYKFRCKLTGIDGTTVYTDAATLTVQEST